MNVASAPMPAPGLATLQGYRPWRGGLLRPWRGTLAITRSDLARLARRKLVWVLFAFSTLIFFGFFFGQYLVVWAAAQVGEGTVRAGGFMTIAPKRLVEDLGHDLKLDGSGETFRNLFWYEGLILNVALALVGAQLVGNDFRYRVLPFYLAKPITARHYVAGKCLAAAAVVQLMTTLPALLLYIEYGLLDGWEYFWEARRLIGGIMGYGLLISAVLSILLIALASWVKKTVPLILIWSALFVLAPAVGRSLHLWTGQTRWLLVDLWNNCYVIGNWLLGVRLTDNPAPWKAAAVLGVVSVASLMALTRRVRAVEVV